MITVTREELFTVKRFTCCIMAALFTLCFATSINLMAGQKASDASQTTMPAPKSNAAPTVPNNSPQIINEPDQTDVLAIPLDNSEDEENMEMKDLQDLQAEIQAKKAASAK